MRRAHAVLLLAGLAACGGSGGGGGDGDGVGGTPLVGAFSLSALRGDYEGASASLQALFAAAAADGTASIEVNGARNVDGTVSTEPPFTIAAGYESDGSFAVNDRGELARGWFGFGQRVGLVGSVEAGGDPSITVLLKRWTSPAGSNGALSGLYQRVSFGKPASVESVVTSAEFVGDGNVGFGFGSANQEGTLYSPGLSSGTYAVSSDGATVLTHLGETFSGGALEIDDPLYGSTLVVLAGTTPNGEPPAILAFVRFTTGSNATFLGSYGAVGIGYSPSAPGFRSFTGTIDADGAGTATRRLTRNAEGVVEVLAADTASYAVAGDGTMTIDTADGRLQGAISGNGAVAVLGGYVTAGADPVFFLLMRR